MSEQESLSDIVQTPFKSSPVTTDAKSVTAEKTTEVEVAPSAAKVEEKSEAKTDRDEKGRFAKAEEKPIEKAEKPRADVAAIMDERRKRQALEARLRELEAQKPEKPMSVFEDEDKAIQSRVDKGTQDLRGMLFKQSVKYARLAYKESFGEAESSFMEAAEGDPRLYEALRQSDDPGEYIYTVGLQIRELADVGGDFMKYREKISSGYQSQLSDKDAEIARLTKDLETLKGSQAELDSIPRSLNNRSSGPSPKLADTDADDLNSIVRFGKPNR